MTTSTSAAQAASRSAGDAQQSARTQRYIQLALVVLAAGTIYPMLYLRQYYGPTMQAFFGINDIQLGQLYSTLGLVFVACYIPSGWLADRVAPRILISFSLYLTGALGFLYSTAPAFPVLIVIFGCWGVSTGLTFWSAVIKRVNSIATDSERGRFFGMLDGGRGLVEASLAFIAVSVFAYFTRNHSEFEGFRVVLLMYSTLCMVIATVLAFIKDKRSGVVPAAPKANTRQGSTLDDLKTLAKIPDLWILAAVVFCGYQLFWSTYNFAAYLRVGDFGLAATVTGFITMAKMWTRPVAGIGGGYLADKLSREGVLAGVLVCGSAALATLALMPAGAPLVALVGLVLFVGLMAYGVRGLYWALLDKCKVPEHCTGLAIGLVSMIGYSPDIFLPLLSGHLTTKYPHGLGYRYFFFYIVAVALCGAFGALVLKRRFGRQAKRA